MSIVGGKLRGRRGILLVTRPLVGALGCRRSLNLTFNQPHRRGGRCNALPFCFCPLFFFSVIFNALTSCLSTDCTNFPVLIIVNDGWDLSISVNTFLARITRRLMSGNDRLRYNFGNLLLIYSFDFRNFAWVENATQEVGYRPRKLL